MQWATSIIKKAYRDCFVASYLFRSLAEFEENLTCILTDKDKTVSGPWKKLIAATNISHKGYAPLTGMRGGSLLSSPICGQHSALL